MNALALNTLEADARLLTPRRALAAYLTEIRFEFMWLLRNPALAAPVVLVPLALYLLFVALHFLAASLASPSQRGCGTGRGSAAGS